MEYTVIAILAVAAVLFVAYPLFGKRRSLYDIESACASGEAAELRQLLLKKARAEENLREFEFEHDMGKLSGDDYTALRDGYAKEIEDASRSLDAHKARKEIEDLIESEARARRRIK